MATNLRIEGFLKKKIGIETKSEW